MPKRVATPPPPDDAEYLTVVAPYPLNPNWELPADRVAFARWIACVLGGFDPFFSFYYKPKALGMVIIEIDKEYDNFKGLLGEHRWAEFLRSPTDEESDRKSQIFYCLYKSDRQAQKDGWKRITVDEKWFSPEKWSVKNKIMKHPYPPTHWCNTPPEDQTNKKLCRPLPASIHTPPPPEKPAPAVVGSSGWTSAKSKTPTPQQKQQAQHQAWATQSRGAAPAKAQPRNNLWGAQHPTASNVTPITPKSKNSPAPGGSNISAGSVVPPDLISSTVTDASSIQTMSTPHDEKYGTMKNNPTLTIVGEDDDDSDDGFCGHDGISGDGFPTSSNVTSKDEDQWSDAKDKKEEVLCPVHGIICRKGICEEMSHMKRKQKIAEEREKKAKAKAEWMSKAESKRAKHNKKNGKTMVEVNNDPPLADSAEDWDPSRTGTPPESSSSESDKDDDESQSKASTVNSKAISKPWDEYSEDDEW